MFGDRSLVPSEALRLAALGLLAEAPRRYADLAAEIRHLTSRIVGPSPELMGTSLELLRHEGLAEAMGDPRENPELCITTAGRSVLGALLVAGIRTPISDLARLGLVLKLRFLHHLPADAQKEQRTQIAAAWQSELARLEDLRAHNAGTPGYFPAWLDHEIAEVRSRIAWIEAWRDVPS